MALAALKLGREEVRVAVLSAAVSTLASLRFAESCIGAGITVLAAHLWPEGWRTRVP